MQTITINDFSMDIHDGSIGVYISGGADSTLLLYLLMKHVKGPLQIFSCANGKTNFREPINAMQIINRVIQLTNKTNIRLHVNWEDHKTFDTIIQPEFMHSVSVDTLYFGLTRPPPAGAIVDFDTDAAVGGVDDGEVKPTYFDSKSCPPWYALSDKQLPDPGFVKNYCIPFININKQEIASLYRELGIEDLYKMTRSCESLTINDRHCGGCWWCKERIWGFGYLD